MTLNKKLVGSIFAVMLFAAAANAQWGTPNAYGYNTGYGAVYGTFSHAALMQSMYNVARSQQLARQSGSPQQPRSGRTAQTTGTQVKAAPAPAALNYGAFRPDSSVDTGKLMSESLGSTPEEKLLIKQIYATTKASYDKEAAVKGWSNNIAGGLTFFTIAAITIYHDAGEPDDAAVDDYFRAVNASIDSVPEFATVSNREKQSFNNMMIGFGGMLLAIYTEGKQNNHAGTIDASKKLSKMLIEMVLKADPEKMRIENGRIVLN